MKNIISQDDFTNESFIYDATKERNNFENYQKKWNYSKTLELFEPVKIQMLKTKRNLKKNDTFEMEVTPANLYIGWGGQVEYSFSLDEPVFVEGVDFKFI